MRDDVRPFAAIGWRFRISIPNHQSKLAERFIRLWGKIQNGVRESPDRCESEPKWCTSVEALVKVVEYCLINFAGMLKRI